MKFCLATTFYPPYSFGGDAFFVQQLAHLLADQGHSVDVIHCRDSYRLLGGDSTAARPEHPGVRVHTLASPYGWLSPVTTYLTGHPHLKPELRSLLKQPYDVIHFHNISLLGGPGLLTLGRGLKLYTSHEYWLHCPTHLLLKYGREPCQSKSCWSCSLSYGRPPQPWRWLDTLESSLTAVDCFLYPTQFGADLHSQQGLPGPVEVLPNFVFDPGPAPKEEREGFLFVGRLEWLKGIEDLVSLFRERSEPLTVVGSGSLEPKLRSSASRNVTITGRLSRRELSHHYRRAKAVLVPSRCYELLPLVLLEALAHSTPVVVSPMGELPAVALESQAGLVAGPRKEWHSALDQLSEPDLVKRMGRMGRNFFEQNYTPEIHLKSYFDLIEKSLTPR